MRAAVIGGADESDCGANLMRDVRRRSGCENKAARVIDEKFGERAAAANKSADAGESFSARINRGEKAVSTREFGGEAAALRAENANGVSFVGNQIGIVFFRELHNFSERRDVALHAEDTFGDDKPCARHILSFAQ